MSFHAVMLSFSMVNGWQVRIARLALSAIAGPNGEADADDQLRRRRNRRVRLETTTASPP